MVKFGRHLQFYLDLEQPEGEHYIVPYTEIRDIIGDSNDSEQFVEEWRECLRLSSEDFAASTAALWRKVFAVLHNQPEARGARIEDALQLYVSVEDIAAGHDLLASARELYSAAEVNGEALRKLVKKFDKHALERGDNLLTPSLLPELYASAFSSSLASLERNIDTLRRLTSEVAGDSGWEADSETNSQRSKQDEESVQRRAEEFQWLNDTVASICPSDLPHVVAHRGFHNPHGLVDVRPVENSLQAYEAAWSSGIHLCECDVALTKDEKLILAHDEDFSRLALIPSSNASKTKVKDLTLRQIMSMQLKSGIRPPLLIDVLQSAMAIGPHAKLIIEIKPGNSEAGSALARLFTKHPELMNNVEVIMSFDAFIVHSLQQDLKERFGPPSTPPTISGVQHSMAESYNKEQSSLGKISATLDNNIAEFYGICPPKVMLVTVAEPPQRQCELWADVDDLSKVEGWLKHEGDALDGVYLQFQPKMLQPEGAAALKEFSQKYAVGVWGLLGRDPDDYPTLQALVRDGGVTYYNTDLPRSFFKTTKRQLSPPLLQDEDDDESIM